MQGNWRAHWLLCQYLFPRTSLDFAHLGVILAIGFAIIGLPMGILLGLFMGLLNMIPYLQVLSYIPLVLLVGLRAVATGENFFLLLSLPQ